MQPGGVMARQRRQIVPQPSGEKLEALNGSRASVLALVRGGQEEIDQINSRLTESGSRLFASFRHAILFKPTESDPAGSLGYSTFCTFTMTGGVRFLGDKLVRAEIHPVDPQYLFLPEQPNTDQLVLVDSEAHVGVSICEFEEVAVSALAQYNRIADHQKFLATTQEFGRGERIWIDNAQF